MSVDDAGKYFDDKIDNGVSLYFYRVATTIEITQISMKVGYKHHDDSKRILNVYFVCKH